MQSLPHLAAAALLVATFGACGAPKPAAAPAEIRARQVTALPKDDPAAPLWAQAPEFPARLLLQDVAEPKLLTPGVEAVKVRALHDGVWIAFRLEWADATRDELQGPTRFSDAAAVQLPGKLGADVPDPAMGLPAWPVQIMFWKAAWQQTGDPVKALHPNMTVDHYPFAPAAKETVPALEAQYAPARAAGNPSATRGGPVQDLDAEGYGSLTARHPAAAAPASAPAAPAGPARSTGKGLYRDGHWLVTFARPLGPADSSPLQPGKRTYAAFAVWDGAARHVGARKMRSAWVPLELEKTP